MTSPRKLLLFDIDGTLLRSRGVGRTAVDAALSSVLGQTITSAGISFSGKTDGQILSDILQKYGIPWSEDLQEALLSAYTALMYERLGPDGIDLMPGIVPLLETLAAEPRVQLAILTGNIEPMAALKLEMAGLDHFFPFGAYGSDHAERPQLPAVALARAHQHTGHTFAGKDVVIIGDTEHDIHCGRHLGVYAVAVCTGHFSRDDLAPHAPDLLLDDLSDPAQFAPCWC